MTVAKARDNKLIFLTVAFAILMLFFSLSGAIRGVFSSDETEKTYTYYDSAGNSEELTREQYEAKMNEETTEAFRNSKSGVLNSATDSSSSMVTAATNSVGSALINTMVSNFSPTFEAWGDMEYGRPMNTGFGDGVKKDVLTTLSMTETDFAINMPQAYRILSVSKTIGKVLATVFVIVNLMICLFGQASSIRTNVIRIMAMYAVSLLGITLAYKLIVIFTDSMYNIWNIVMSYKDVPLSWFHFTTGKSVILSLFIVDGLVGASLVGLGLMSFPLFALIIGILFIILIWKFVKGIFRLYCQIIEYYLIFIILLLLFPMVLPTIISPTTSNIFKSYCRMVVTQVLLLTMTSLMLKTFTALLIQGAFFIGPANYIAGLAFIKISQNLQQYASAMGLNSVQATGNFTSAVGRGFGAFALSALGAVRMASFGGQMLKNAGVAMNNERLFSMGSALANPAQTLLMSRTAEGRTAQRAMSHDNFTEAIIKKNNASGFVDYKGFGSIDKSTLSHTYDKALKDNFGGTHATAYNIKSHEPVKFENDKVDSIRQYENGNVLISGINKDGMSNILVDKNGEVIGKNLVLEQNASTDVNPDIVGSNFMMGGNGYGQDGNNKMTAPIIGSDIDDFTMCQEITGGMIGQFSIDNPSAMFAVEQIPDTHTAEGYQARYSYTIPEGAMNEATYNRLNEMGFKDRGTKVTEQDGKSYLTHIFDRRSFVKGDIKADDNSGMGRHQKG